MSGQVMVEFALVLVVFVMMFLGAMHVGMLMTTRMQLIHAAQQGAAAGAAEPAVPRRCDTALDTAQVIYGRALEDVRCTQPGNVLEVRLVDFAPQLAPGLPIRVEVTGRAVERKAP